MALAEQESKHVYNVHEAKTQLSKLLELAQAGEEVVIAKAGDPCVRLTPVKSRSAGRRTFGLHKGKIRILDGFDDPLPEFEDYL